MKTSTPKEKVNKHNKLNEKYVQNKIKEVLSIVKHHKKQKPVLASSPPILKDRRSLIVSRVPNSKFSLSNPFKT